MMSSQKIFEKLNCNIFNKEKEQENKKTRPTTTTGKSGRKINWILMRWPHLLKFLTTQTPNYIISLWYFQFTRQTELLHVVDENQIPFLIFTLQFAHKNKKAKRATFSKPLLMFLKTHLFILFTVNPCQLKPFSPFRDFNFYWTSTAIWLVLLMFILIQFVQKEWLEAKIKKLTHSCLQTSTWKSGKNGNSKAEKSQWGFAPFQLIHVAKRNQDGRAFVLLAVWNIFTIIYHLFSFMTFVEENNIIPKFTKKDYPYGLMLFFSLLHFFQT